MNREYKLKKIREMSSEVNDFHPVLNDLFPKLSEITRVEYTHGPNEMGADFVLQKRDSTLDCEDYIGVIVKCGNIRQDFSDIERQIKECAVSRKIEGGKKILLLMKFGSLSMAAFLKMLKRKSTNYSNFKTLNSYGMKC